MSSYPNNQAADNSSTLADLSAIIDDAGVLAPGWSGDPMFPSCPSHVAHYASMYPEYLARQGLGGDTNLELFVELHRRASEQFSKDGRPYKWSREETSCIHHSNARLVADYYEKWDVRRRGGMNYLPDYEGR